MNIFRRIASSGAAVSQAILLAFTAAAHAQSQAPAQVGKADIVIVHSLAMSSSDPTAQAKAERIVEGTVAAFNEANEAKALGAHTLRLRSLDDKGSIDAAAKNIQSLAISPEVIGVINLVGQERCMSAMPSSNEMKMPLLGCIGGSPQLSKASAGNWFTTRPSYEEEYRVMAEQISKHGTRRVAFLHDGTSTGLLHAKIAKDALAVAGMSVVESLAAPLDSNGNVLFDKVRQSGAEAVLSQAPPAALAAVVRTGKERNTPITFFSISGGAEDILDMLKIHARGVVFTQVVPSPFHSNRLTGAPAVVQQYLDAMAKSFPESKPSYDSLESYINARVLVEALKRAPAPYSRAGLRGGLLQLTDTSIGGFKVSFSQDNRSGSRFTETVMGTTATCGTPRFLR